MDIRYFTREPDEQDELSPREEAPSRFSFAVVLAVIMAAIASIFVFPAKAAELEETRLRHLMKFAGQALGVGIYNVELPRIIYTSSDIMQIQIYGNAVASNRLPVMAIYEEGAMILDESVDYTLPKNEFVLVHELVHHVQYHYDMEEDVYCTNQLELAAYRAQNLWVLATGYGETKNALTVHFIAECPNGD